MFVAAPDLSQGIPQELQDHLADVDTDLREVENAWRAKLELDRRKAELALENIAQKAGNSHGTHRSARAA